MVVVGAIGSVAMAAFAGEMVPSGDHAATAAVAAAEEVAAIQSRRVVVDEDFLFANSCVLGRPLHCLDSTTDRPVEKAAGNGQYANELHGVRANSVSSRIDVNMLLKDRNTIQEVSYQR